MRESDVPQELIDFDCPEFTDTPWQPGPSLTGRRIALVSTAGLMHEGDRPFSLGHVDYRIIESDPAKPILMSHISTNFDRSGFADDYNVVFPLDRLREMADAGEIGSVADYHYSFMGATEPQKMEPAARSLAGILIKDEVDLALLIPV